MDEQKNTILSLGEPAFRDFYSKIETNGLSIILLYNKMTEITDDVKNEFKEIATEFGIEIGEKIDEAIEDLRKRKYGGKPLG